MSKPINISVPDDLYKRVKRHKQIQISSVCQTALLEAVEGEKIKTTRPKPRYVEADQLGTLLEKIVECIDRLDQRDASNSQRTSEVPYQENLATKNQSDITALLEGSEVMSVERILTSLERKVGKKFLSGTRQKLREELVYRGRKVIESKVDLSSLISLDEVKVAVLLKCKHFGETNVGNFVLSLTLFGTSPVYAELIKGKTLKKLQEEIMRYFPGDDPQICMDLKLEMNPIYDKSFLAE